MDDVGNGLEILTERMRVLIYFSVNYHAALGTYFSSKYPAE